jgi:hypothetical protein
MGAALRGEKTVIEAIYAGALHEKINSSASHDSL